MRWRRFSHSRGSAHDAHWLLSLMPGPVWALELSDIGSVWLDARRPAYLYIALKSSSAKDYTQPMRVSASRAMAKY
jgi:hypothetical protein